MEFLNRPISLINRPDAKRKLLIAFVFVFCFALGIAAVEKNVTSFTAWGSLLALAIMAITAWPLMKEFVWPTGLEHTASTQLSLACHGWKNAYFSVDPELMKRLETSDGDNIWGEILSTSNHQCSSDNISKFKPLFVNETINTLRRIDAVIIRYGDVLPDELRVLAQNTMTQLSLAPFSYSMFINNPSDQAFHNQFRGVIHTLSKLERPAHELQGRTKID